MRYQRCPSQDLRLRWPDSTRRGRRPVPSVVVNMRPWSKVEAAARTWCSTQVVREGPSPDAEISDSPLMTRLVQTFSEVNSIFLAERAIDRSNRLFALSPTLSALAFGLPRRNAAPIDHYSGVPHPCLALELAPPAIPPLVYHRCIHLPRTDTGERAPLHSVTRTRLRRGRQVWKLTTRGAIRAHRRKSASGEDRRSTGISTVSVACGVGVRIAEFVLISHSLGSAPLDVRSQPSTWSLAHPRFFQG